MGLMTMDFSRQLLFLGQAQGTHLADCRRNVFGRDPAHAVALSALPNFKGNIESSRATERSCRDVLETFASR
jgi:hypothetical protein